MLPLASKKRSSATRIRTRRLFLQALEPRVVFAGDSSPLHNELFGSDVDGDFKLTPIDALLVINHINSGSPRSVNDLVSENAIAAQSSAMWLDVDGDFFITPLDALSVIQSVNRGEGIGELVQVKYEFYATNPDGTLGRNLDPNPLDTIQEAIVGKGEGFAVRTLMADTRTLATGIHAAYHDLSYENVDQSPSEKIQLQWSEFNSLLFERTDENAVVSGSFRLSFGSAVTKPIQYATRSPRPGVIAADPDTTAKNIQAAIEELAGFGVGNVRVLAKAPQKFSQEYGISYRNSLARKDLANADLADTNALLVSSGQVFASIGSQTDPTPSTQEVATTASNFMPSRSGQTTVFYDQGQRGSLDESKASIGQRTLSFHGGFVGVSQLPTGSEGNFYAVSDTYFVAAATGEISFLGNIAASADNGSQKLGISLLSAKNVYLPSSQVEFTPAKLTVVDRLTAVPNSFTVSEDSSQASFDVVENDQDQFGSSRGIVSVTQPDRGGNIAIESGPSPQKILFTPSPDFNGVSVFTYTIRNNLDDVATGTVSINVSPVNDAPIAKQQNLSLVEDASSPLTIAPIDLFSPGPDNESNQKLSLAILSAPSSSVGSAVLNAQGAIEFTPAKDFFGSVTMVVQAVDDGPTPPSPNPKTTNTVTINVTAVNDPPVPLSIQPTITEDSPTPLVLTASQIFSPGPANESTQSISLEILAGPSSQQGTASLLSNGSLQFNPAKDYFGVVILKLRALDNGSPALSATTDLTLNVSAVNDPPTVIKTTYATEEDSTNPLIIIPADVFSPGPANESTQAVSFSIINGPTTDQGTATLDQTGRLVFSPAKDFFGTVNITVSGVDNGPTPPSPNPKTNATLTIQVGSVNDPPEVVRTSYSIAEDPANPMLLLPADLFRPGPSNELSQSVILAITKGPAIEQGTASVLPTGVIEFRPAQNYFGTVLLSISGTDNGAPTGVTNSTVTINITPVNDPPTASDDTARSNQLIAVVQNGIISKLDVMKNDIAGPNESSIDSIRIKSISDIKTTLGGTLSISPDRLFLNYLPPGNGINQTDSFSYTIEDSAGLTSTARAEVNLVPPTLPFAVNDGYVESEKSSDTTYTYEVTNNDLLTAGSFSRLLGIIKLPASGQGTVTLQGTDTPNDPKDDRLIYTAPAYYQGVTVLEYQMTDSSPGSVPSIGTVRITVTEVNDPPVAIAKFAETNEDALLTISAAEFTKDLSRGPFEDSQTLSITNVRVLQSDFGTASIIEGNIRYSPAKDFNGQSVLEYTVRDNGKTNGVDDFKTSSAFLTITVLPINDAPVTSTKELPVAPDKILEDTPFSIPIASILAGDRPGPLNESTQNLAFVSFTGKKPTSKGGFIQIVDASLVYTPPNNFNSLSEGQDSFGYEVSDDGTPPLITEGLIRLLVQEVNDPPIAKEISRELFAGVSTRFDLSDELVSMDRGAKNESNQSIRIKELIAPQNFKGTISLDSSGHMITLLAPIGTDETIDVKYIIEDNGTTAGSSAPLQAEGILHFKVFPFQPSTIQGQFFIDDNRNGKFDTTASGTALELPVGGVEVMLTYADPLNPSQKLTKVEMTRADGRYVFDFLPPTVYTISYSTPAGMVGLADSDRSRSVTVEAPGNKQVEFNFPLLGLQMPYGTTIEYLASSFYQNDPSLQSRGLYATVNTATGYSEWTSRKSGFGGYFYELVLSSNGSTAFLTEIRSDKQVYTAVLNEKSEYVRTAMPDGYQLVRVLASESQLHWNRVDRSIPPFTVRGYLDAVDDFFTQQNW
jgi:hypothetical protein